MSWEQERRRRLKNSMRPAMQAYFWEEMRRLGVPDAAIEETTRLARRQGRKAAMHRAAHA